MTNLNPESLLCECTDWMLKWEVLASDDPLRGFCYDIKCWSSVVDFDASTAIFIKGRPM